MHLCLLFYSDCWFLYAEGRAGVWLAFDGAAAVAGVFELDEAAEGV